MPVPPKTPPPAWLLRQSAAAPEPEAAPESAQLQSTPLPGSCVVPEFSEVVDSSDCGNTLPGETAAPLIPPEVSSASSRVIVALPVTPPEVLSASSGVPLPVTPPEVLRAAQSSSAFGTDYVWQAELQALEREFARLKRVPAAVAWNSDQDSK